MLPPQPEEEKEPKTKTNENIAEYAHVTSAMNMLLQPIAENLEDHRPSFTTITTLPKFNIRKSVRYTANQRFKVRKTRRRRRRKRRGDGEDNEADREDEDEDEDDDDEEAYDIWNRPPIENAEANSNGKQLILTEYDGLDSNIDHFVDLMLENETECDKLAQLLCNKKLTSKDVSKQNELFDILRLNDADDDGGLNPDDYDIDMREMEHLLHKFNNDILHSFMCSYYGEKLPFEPRQPYPMGQIETDITKERKVKSVKNANYMTQHRRKNKQRLKEKHNKKKERARKKRRREKKLEMKLAQKKLNVLNAHLAKQLAPETLNILFQPRVIDPNNINNDDDGSSLAADEIDAKEKEERILDLNVDIAAATAANEDDDEALRTDDEALGAVVSNSEAKERIKQMRLERARSRRKVRQQSDRHSAAMQSPVIQQLLHLTDGYRDKESAQFDDYEDCDVKREIGDVFSEEQLQSMAAPPAMSKDYDGSVKRYARPIKMDHVEKVFKFVLFKAARQYFKRQYVENVNITACVERELEVKRLQYDEIKKTEENDENDEMVRFISQCMKRDLDVFVQNHYVTKQRAMLQLMSMGVDIDDIAVDPEEESEFEEKEEAAMMIRDAFVSGVDGMQIAAEDKLINHDEDDDLVRQSAIVYDSDDDAMADQRWKSRSKWIQKALTDFVDSEVKSNEYAAKPWKKLHSKYVDEFVNKFCGFYPYESRPVAWKRIWHQNCNENSTAMWPPNWMDLFNEGRLEMEEFAGGDGSDGDEEENNNNNNCKRVPCIKDTNIASLPLNLEDVALPKFVWKLNKNELSSQNYGTYLFANWKQASNGKVTTAVHPCGERFPILQFRTDLEQRRWHAEMKWFVYRLRYWEASDIMDFLDDSEGKEGVAWYGSNDYGDSDKFTLLEDRICIQNDSCFGAPSLFLWSHDFCNETGPTCKPIKIRNYGVSPDVASSDPIIQQEKSVFNLSAPIVPTGKMAVDGPLRSGTKLAIGAQDALDLDDINGLIAMDCYIPPVFNLSVYDDADTLYYNWNRVNHDCLVPDRASSKRMQFRNRDCAFDLITNEENNILKSYDVDTQQWCDFNNYPVFCNNCKHPCVLSNAFFFNNFLSRTYHDGGHKNLAKINYPRGWQEACCHDDRESDDEWTFSFGFTHPRPIAPEKYAVLFYKKDCIEVRITSNTEKLAEPIHIDEHDEDEVPLNYSWSEERLEIMIFIHCDGKQKSVPLFSEIIRTDFEKCDAFYHQNYKNSKKCKKFVFVENNFMSHVVILSQSQNGDIKCYLDGKIVCHQNLKQLAGSGAHKNSDEIKTHMLLKNQKEENVILLAHKPGNKEGRVHGLFHGYLYAIALHATALQPFELNTMYRQMCVHRDLHVTKTWFRNKLQAADPKIKHKCFF